MASALKRIQAWQLVVVAAIVTCGAFLAGLSFAKMVDSTADKDGSLGVAKWDVRLAGADEMSLMAGGEAETYIVTVTNDSDVACSYDIVISGIPEGVQVALGNEGAWEEYSSSVTFSNVGLLEASGGNDSKILRFKAGIGTGNISDGEMKINVQFTQEEL